MDGQAVATWIQAIGSAGSLLAFAAWVGIAVINRKDDNVLRFERQAQTVAAWWSTVATLRCTTAR